jgi:imidazolonepropionase-like amidohydrolase
MPYAPRLLSAAVLVALIVAAGSTAQAQPLTAIVGARIIDGSGNEPFVGTIVMEGGRIRAVGRSVEAPAGAVTIDGAGRTVMPGLIDVRLSIASADSGAIARAMAAALYGGVTTAAAVDLPANRFEAARALGGRPEAGPRLVIVGGPEAIRSGVQALLVSPDAAGADAAAADARSRGLRVFVTAGAEATLDRLLAFEPSLILGTPAIAGGAASLSQRNVTVAPDSAAVGSGRGAAAVRALRDARVRLALMGTPSGAGTDSGYGLPVTPLVEAGASALDAVTAATSGGAWALGVQSDRGFLAGGMRADLLVVQGDPATRVADLERIDRVFLGGVEVDRAALLTRVRAADAAATPAATTSAPAPTAPMAEATGTKPPASGVDRPGAARRRGRGKAAAPAPAETATAPAPAASAGTTPPAVTPAAPAPAPPGPTPSPSAPASGAPPSAPASAAPSPTPAAPTTDPSPTPALPPSSPAPAATVTAAVPRLDDPLIDDFERAGAGDALGAWASGASEGASPATIVMGRVVRGLRDHALHLTARVGQGSAPFVRAAIPLSADGSPVDVSRFRGLRFDARGEGRYRIVFVTRSIADGRFHESYFSGSPLWTPVGIPFASIGQNGAGGHASFTGRDLIEIRFEIARAPGQMAWLELDNVKFY